MHGAMWCAMNGPNVSAPHRPMTTLGIPASSSRNPPTTLADLPRQPLDDHQRGADRHRHRDDQRDRRGYQRADDLRQRAELLALPDAVTPSVVTGHAVAGAEGPDAPGEEAQPLNLIAGIAWTTSVIRTNPASAPGARATTRPSQRMTAAAAVHGGSARRAGERAAARSPSRRQHGAEAAIRTQLPILAIWVSAAWPPRSAAAAGSSPGPGSVAFWPGGDDPVQERPDVLGLRCALGWLVFTIAYS